MRLLVPAWMALQESARLGRVLTVIAVPTVLAGSIAVAYARTDPSIHGRDWLLVAVPYLLILGYGLRVTFAESVIRATWLLRWMRGAWLGSGARSPWRSFSCWS
jgi:hypothetical protein